jgi:hypothetical protein
MKFQHEGIDIEVNKQGIFVATVDGDEVVGETLEKIREAITRKRKRVARVHAAAAPCVAYIEERYAIDDRKARWVTATFRGINSRTGDYLLTVNGEKEQVGHAWLRRSTPSRRASTRGVPYTRRDENAEGEEERIIKALTKESK